MKIVAEGNVVFEMEDLKIVATELEADLNAGTGVFQNAVGSAGQDLYFQADTVEKVSRDDYILRGGAFTSCAQPSPRWQFVAGEARIRRDRHVRLHNAFLKVKSIPVFYVPFVQYPIDDEERSTGFLAPNFGSSSEKGLYFSEAFFWAISRSADTTFFLDTHSEGGVGGGTELR